VPEPKRGSTRVAFGDIVRLSKERTSDPLADGFDRYVGLEHIDPGDLRIRRWGDVADGTTFTTIFRPGHVLFGKRRAYQKKVALADFRGVCSGDIYVFEADEQRLLPDLLPYICLSEEFFAHAIRTSAGSLSPRTNWSSLASYELLLPPLSEQRRIAGALGAAHNTSERLRDLTRSHLRVIQSLYQSEYGRRVDLVGAARGTPIARLSSIRRGASPRPIRDPKWFSDSGPGWVRIRDIPPNTRLLRSTEQRLSELGASRSVRVRPGEVILSIAATIGRPAIADADLCIHDGFVVFQDLSPELDRDYLFHFLRWMEPVLESMGQLGTQKNLNTTIVGSLTLELPALERQRKAAALMNELFDTTERYAERAALAAYVGVELVHPWKVQ